MGTAMLIIVIIIVLIALFVVAQYNRFIDLRNRVKNSWAQIDVQLKRRADLIPNLVETVKGYAGHESQTLERVIQARNAAISAPSTESRAAAEGELSGALRQLFALSESYPDLKANTNFLELQDQLESTEDKISYMRQSYNDVVQMYNTAIQQFPGNIISGFTGFTAAESFEVQDETVRQAPQVSFGETNSPFASQNNSDSSNPKE
ncbi:MAG: LemA family protein [Coriobacteriia bacterium]|nr:LemA family protein [Coriobacteriia bacterium]